MRAWSGFGLGAALIATAYVTDGIVDHALREAQATFTVTSVIWLDVIARVAVLTLILILAWLVLRGPRSRAAGLAMVILGFYAAVLPQLGFVLPEFADIMARPPFMSELLGRSGGFATWAATAVTVLGLMELLRPTAAEAPIRL